MTSPTPGGDAARVASSWRRFVLRASALVPWLVCALGIMDVSLTLVGLANGGQELNPIAAAVLALGGVLSLVLFVLMKVAALWVYAKLRGVLRRPDAVHPYAGRVAALLVDTLALLAGGGAVVVGLNQLGRMG